MEFPPDIGFVIQIATFLILWWILKVWMFDPTMRLLELRRQRTEGQLEDAERIAAATEKIRAEYEAKLQAAQESARREVATIRAEGEREEEKILASARAEAAEVVDGVREKIGREVEAARASIVRYAAEISVEAAEKILGRRVQ